MAFHNINHIDLSKVVIEDPVRDGNGGLGCQVTYNGAPLKIRVPAGLVTGFQVGKPIFHTDGSGRAEVIQSASLTCIIGFNGCDPYGKARCVADSSAGSIYNFVFEFYDRIVKHCLENGVKLFGKNRSESVIRESMTCFHIDVMKDNGELVPSGKGRPSVRATILYSEMEQRGDVRMARTDDVYSTPFAVISPSVGSKEFYMTPHLLIFPQNRLRIAWKVGYVSEV
jgi:hypothetical protein